MHQEYFLTCSTMFNIHIPNSNICIAMLLISEYDILSGFLPHFRIFPCILKEKYPKISINYTYVPWKTKYTALEQLIEFIFCNSKERKTLLRFYFTYDLKELSIQMLGIKCETPQCQIMLLQKCLSQLDS